MKILLGISGSISAYKAADIVSLFKKQGHEVRCILTESAKEFVSPLVLETLSGEAAISRLFGADVSGTEHIRLARWPDLILIAPASAHLLARISLGLADDLISTVVLASQAPIAVSPAMNTVMWDNPVTQEHLARLKKRGIEVLPPIAGGLACGEWGEGKLPTPEAIVEWTNRLLSRMPASGLNSTSIRQPDLQGMKFLITAGPTTTPIDAVRYITNPSTGKMGASLAEAIVDRGGEVYYVLGVDKGVVRPQISPAAGSRFHLTEVTTAEEMADAAERVLPLVSGVIATAAVMDYRVKSPTAHKQKRAAADLSLELTPSRDVLGMLRDKARPNQWLMGFAAETAESREALIELGRNKLERKRLQFLFVNPVARLGEKTDAGFGSDQNTGFFLTPGKSPIELSLQGKGTLAHLLIDYALAELKHSPSSPGSQ